MNPSTRVPPPTERAPHETFSSKYALRFTLWIYAVTVLVGLSHWTILAHAWALVGSALAGCALEWLRSRGSRDYAAVFFILLTLAPLLYRYQHG